MPSLDGEKYSYGKKGIRKYLKALKEKRKNKNKGYSAGGDGRY